MDLVLKVKNLVLVLSKKIKNKNNLGPCESYMCSAL